MKIKIGNLGLDYDRAYGINKQSGWSVSWKGSYINALQPHLIPALFKAWRIYRSWHAL